MPIPDDGNEFGLGELRSPMRRAESLKARHANRSLAEKTWDFAVGIAPYVSTLANPTTAGFEIAIRAARDPKVMRVFRAVQLSLDDAVRLMGAQSLQIKDTLLASIVPMLGQLAEYAGIGAVVGGVVGAVGGLGVLDEATIPGGAAAGAALGIEIGGYVGIIQLLSQGAVHFDRFTTYAIDATELAYYAGEDRAVSTDHDVHDAAKLFAVAISELWWLILQALVAYVLKKVAEGGSKGITAATRTEAFAEVRAKTAKFGTAFGDWFEQNFNQIREALQRRQKEFKQVEDGDGGQASGDSGSSSKKGDSRSGKESTTGTFGKVPETIKTSSGTDIHPASGKTTTILGSFKSDMNNVINGQLEYPKTTDFGGKPDGYNVLNVPDDLYKTPDQFWHDYNKPFVDQAIERGDPISLATAPTDDVLINPQTGGLTGFGREITYLQSSGYEYNPTTSQMIKP